MDGAKKAIIKFLYSQAWAIKPEYIEVIGNVLYAKYFASAEYREEQLEKFHAAYGTTRYSNSETWITDGVAVVPVVGIMGKRLNMVGGISTRGVSTDVLTRTMASIMNDPNVEAIVGDFHTPGGAVSGSFDAAEAIFNMRGKKPMIAVANDMMASAGYLVASPFDKIFSTVTGDVGNIGVYMVHEDWSKNNEAQGVKPTYISAGKYKTLGNYDNPLTEEEMGVLQEDVNTYYKMFVDAVARNRSISAETVMTDARALMPAEAKKRGLIDGVKSLDEAIVEARKMASDKRKWKTSQNVGQRAASLNARMRAALIS